MARSGWFYGSHAAQRREKCELLTLDDQWGLQALACKKGLIERRECRGHGPGRPPLETASTRARVTTPRRALRIPPLSVWRQPTGGADSIRIGGGGARLRTRPRNPGGSFGPRNRRGLTDIRFRYQPRRAAFHPPPEIFCRGDLGFPVDSLGRRNHFSTVW